MVSSSGGRTPFIAPGLADPSATTGSELTGLGCDHATLVGRGTGRCRVDSTGHGPGVASLGAGATGRGHKMLGVQMRWCVSDAVLGCGTPTTQVQL